MCVPGFTAASSNTGVSEVVAVQMISASRTASVAVAAAWIAPRTGPCPAIASAREVTRWPRPRAPGRPAWTRRARSRRLGPGRSTRARRDVSLAPLAAVRSPASAGGVAPLRAASGTRAILIRDRLEPAAVLQRHQSRLHLLRHRSRPAGRPRQRHRSLRVQPGRRRLEQLRLRRPLQHSGGQSHSRGARGGQGR